MTLSVEYVKASWCKVCGTLLPEIQQLCKKYGVLMFIRDYDEMEEDEQAKYSSLPGISLLEDNKLVGKFEKNKKESLEAALEKAVPLTGSDF